MEYKKCIHCGGGLHYDWSDTYRKKNWYTHTKCDNLRRKRHYLYAKSDKAMATTTEGYVYVIVHPMWPDLSKIGFSRNPKGRVAQANTWCPNSKYEVHAAVYSDNAPALEAEVHRGLADRRIERQGEWFSINRWHGENLIRKIKREMEKRNDDTNLRHRGQRVPPCSGHGVGSVDHDGWTTG